LLDSLTRGSIHEDMLPTSRLITNAPGKDAYPIPAYLVLIPLAQKTAKADHRGLLKLDVDDGQDDAALIRSLPDTVAQKVKAEISSP